MLGVTNAVVRIFETDFNAGYEQLLRVLKEKGFIQSYGFRRIYADYPRYLSGQIAFTVPGRDKAQYGNAMVSRKDGINVCYSKMLGEALERHAGLLPDEKDPYYPRVFIATPDFSYADIPQHTHAQKKAYGFLPNDSDPLRDVPCVWAHNTTRGKRMPIPLQCAYYGFKVGRNKLYGGTTNGCGGGFTYEDAALSAVYELIERDAFLLWWFSNLQPPRIEYETCTTPFFEQLKKETTRYNLEVIFLDTSCDTDVFSCACVVIDPVLHIIAIGAKSGQSVDILEGAYLEAIQVLGSSRGKVSEGKRVTDFFGVHAYTSALSQEQRETQVCTPEAIAYIRKHFLSGPEKKWDEVAQKSKIFASKKAELRALIEVFKQHSDTYGNAYNLYLYRFDSQWLRFCNYVTVRAFVPAYIKLHLTEYDATPLSPRLKWFVESHGGTYDPECINRMPHFFP
jgi:thiazole/oxazole-forming peptide maturase SagD family component